MAVGGFPVVAGVPCVLQAVLVPYADSAGHEDHGPGVVGAGLDLQAVLLDVVGHVVRVDFGDLFDPVPGLFQGAVVSGRREDAGSFGQHCGSLSFWRWGLEPWGVLACYAVGAVRLVTVILPSWLVAVSSWSGVGISV